MSNLILSFDVTGIQDSLSVCVLPDDLSSPSETILSHIMVSPTPENPALSKGNSQHQSRVLVPNLQALLKKSGHGFQDVSVLCTLTGPGSFTGIRIGLATAQGLCLARPCLIFAPTTLELLSFIGQKKLGQEKPLMAIIDSKRGDYFALRTNPNDINPTHENHPIILTQKEILQLQSEGISMVSPAPLPDIETIFPLAPLSEALITYYLESTPEFRTLRTTLSPFYLRTPTFAKKNPILQNYI